MSLAFAYASKLLLVFIAQKLLVDFPEPVAQLRVVERIQCTPASQLDGEQVPIIDNRVFTVNTVAGKDKGERKRDVQLR